VGFLSRIFLISFTVFLCPFAAIAEEYKISLRQIGVEEPQKVEILCFPNSPCRQAIKIHKEGTFIEVTFKIDNRSIEAIFTLKNRFLSISPEFNIMVWEYASKENVEGRQIVSLYDFNSDFFDRSLVKYAVNRRSNTHIADFEVVVRVRQTDPSSDE